MGLPSPCCKPCWDMVGTGMGCGVKLGLLLFSNKYGKKTSPPTLLLPGASACQQQELQLLPHPLHPLEFLSLVLPYSWRAVTWCEHGTGPHPWFFSFSSLLIWAMLDLVPFILDQVSTREARGGLMWVVPDGGTSWQSGRVQCPPHFGDVSGAGGFGCNQSMFLRWAPSQGRCGLSWGQHSWVALFVCSDNTAKPLTSLLLSSLLSHSRAHSELCSCHWLISP